MQTDAPCKQCGSPDIRLAYPPKFSPDDKYGKYRREMKKKLREQQPGSDQT